MRARWLSLFALVASTASAQSKITDYCSNAPVALAVTFPLDLSFKITKGEAIVDFVIGTDGAIGDARATSSTDPAFALAAVAAVRRLSCDRRPVPEHLSLPVMFYKPGGVPVKRCPGYLEIAYDPRRFWDKGINNGSVTFEFTIQPSGQITEGIVLRASSPALASETLDLLQEFNCASSTDGAQRVRAAFIF